MAPPNAAASAKPFPRLPPHGSWEDAAKAYADMAFVLAQRLEIIEKSGTDTEAYALAALGISTETKKTVERVLAIVEHMTNVMGLGVPPPRGADALALVDATGTPMRDKAISYQDLAHFKDQIVEEFRDRPTPAVSFVVPGMPVGPESARKEMTSERVRGAVVDQLEKIEHEEEKKLRALRAKRHEEIVTDLLKKALWLIPAGTIAYILGHLTWH